MFDWHFTLRGPRDTEFEGGIYHGRILLPSDYPFKPPNIILLTVSVAFTRLLAFSVSVWMCRAHATDALPWMQLDSQTDGSRSRRRSV